MEKLKIVINGNEHTASKAKELFFKLGYHISSQNRNNAYGWSLGDGVGDYYSNKISFDLDPAKEITIDQLRDMVVLKRNDVNDATHYDSLVNSEILKCILIGDWWYLFTGGIWQQFCHIESGRAQYMKPINDTENILQGKNGDYLVESIEQLKANNVDSTLAERESQYGSFSDVAELTCDLMGDLLRDDMSFVQREALHMICSKLARIRCGDINKIDSWLDIAGYATLVVQDLEKKAIDADKINQSDNRDWVEEIESSKD